MTYSSGESTEASWTGGEEDDDVELDRLQRLDSLGVEDGRSDAVLLVASPRLQALHGVGAVDGSSGIDEYGCCGRMTWRQR
jgi:hypothetical protein